MKCLLIVNPESGTKKIKTKAVDVIKIMNEKGWDVLTCITLIPGDIDTIIENHRDYFDIVVCCGGDGTLKQTIEAVMRREMDAEIGYIPCGTTNDFATGLGLPLEIIDAAKAIVNGELHVRDYGTFNSSAFVYTASFGMFTESSYSTSQEAKNAFGNLAYVMEGLKDLGNIRSYHGKINVDDIEYEGDYVYGGVSNSPIVAGGMLKFDDVQTDDGMFEVLLIKMPNDLIDLNDIIYHLFNNKYDSNMITKACGKKISISFNDPVQFTLDGEYGGSYKEVNIVNKQKAIKMKY